MCGPWTLSRYLSHLFRSACYSMYRLLFSCSGRRDEVCQCSEGSALNWSGRCVDCASECRSCLAATPSVCLSCYQNISLDSGSCPCSLACLNVSPASLPALPVQTLLQIVFPVLRPSATQWTVWLCRGHLYSNGS